MIEVINRELLIPREEYNIGTCYDDNTETRHFHLKRVTSGGVDLAALTFNLDIQYANGSTDAASLIKEVTDKDINLVLTINNSMLQVPGTVLIQIRALDEDGVCKWTSYKSAFFVEDHINTPGHYEGDLTQLEQYEAEWGKVRDNVNQLNLRMDEVVRTREESPATDVEEEVIDARVGADNVVYGSLGSAIRKQFEDAYEAMEDDTEDWTAAVAAEATARQTADNTLQGNIDSEASSRSAADSALSTRINNIIAPSGEAPSIEEVIDARLGYDGNVYPSLGDAIRTQVGNINNATGKYYTIQNGSYVNKKWTDTGYSVFIEVIPGSAYSITASINSASYYGLKSVTFPLEVDDDAVLSDADGWKSSARIVDAGTQEIGIIPDDVHYIYLYAGKNGITRLPAQAIINGVDIFGTNCDNIFRLGEQTTQNTKSITGNQSEIAKTKNICNDLTYAHPYGIQPFQMSLFKQSVNLFSDFCYFINKGYYGINGSTTGKPLTLKSTNNWKGWFIRVKPNTTYTIGPCDFSIVFFDAQLLSDKLYPTSELSEEQPTTIISGDNSCWMALTERIERDMSNWMMVEGDTYPSEYVSGYPQWVNTPKSVTDKTIAFFGDSITAGSGWTGEPDSQGYHQYIHDLYGFTCLNYGYGGSGYVTSYSGTGGLRGIGEPGRGVSNESGSFSPNNVRTRLAEVTPSELDGVVIFAGTNDWSHQVSISDFATELDTVFEYYQTNFGDVPLLVMTPIHRINDANASVHAIPLIDYVNTIIQKCKEHGVPYIDTFSMSGLQPNNAGNSATFFPRDDNQGHSIDGVHPNHLAHQRIARCIGETLNQMMLWNETAIR